MNEPQNPALAAMMQRAVAERVYNFSPGPAALPTEVLLQAADEMLSWHGSGVSVMEMSHRSREFESIQAEALANLRELLQVPKNFRILFLQGAPSARTASCR